MGISSRTKEILVVTYYFCSLANGWINCINSGYCCCSLRLYSILNRKIHILGLSAYYHDSAAALIQDGRILAAAQEERFTRRKHDARFPINAIGYCLNDAGISPKEIDYVVFYDKPFLKFERLLETYLAFAPKGFNSFRKAIPLWLKEKLFQKKLLCDELHKCGFEGNLANKLLFSEHHLSHAASAFFPSPFYPRRLVASHKVKTESALKEQNKLKKKKVGVLTERLSRYFQINFISQFREIFCTHFSNYAYFPSKSAVCEMCGIRGSVELTCLLFPFHQ